MGFDSAELDDMRIYPTHNDGVTAARDFADDLAALPLERWLDVGARLMDDGPLAVRRGAAVCRLEATVVRHALAFDAWLARDAVETAACVVHFSARPLARSEARWFRIARAAAKVNAVALVARAFLASDDFALLSSAFDGAPTRAPIAGGYAVTTLLRV